MKRTGPRPFAYSALRMFAPVATIAMVAAVAGLLAFIFYNALPAFGNNLFFGLTAPLDALLGLRPVWDGIWPAFVGTICLVCLTLTIALFPGVGCGIFLAEYAGPRCKHIAGGAVTILAGTPSIVMGLFGFTLILFLRHTLVPEANTCLVLAALCLALLVLPVLIVSTREALNAVSKEERLTAAALGFSKKQTVRHVLLPAASRGIVSGIVLALGRSAEDTAVIMLTGVVANAGLPAGLSGKFEALPFAVYYITAEYQNDADLARGFGTAVVLLLLAGGLILAAKRLESSSRKRRQGVAA